MTHNCGHVSRNQNTNNSHRPGKQTYQDNSVHKMPVPGSSFHFSKKLKAEQINIQNASAPVVGLVVVSIFRPCLMSTLRSLDESRVSSSK